MKSDNLKMDSVCGAGNRAKGLRELEGENISDLHLTQRTGNGYLEFISIFFPTFAQLERLLIC